MSPYSTIWFAFLVSQVVIGGIGWALAPERDPSADIVVWTLVALVAPMSVMSTVGNRWLGRGTDVRAQQTGLLVRWAFAESATLFGFMATFLGGPRWLAPACAAWGVVLLLLASPNALPPGDRT